MSRSDVTIAGAGLSGLACALPLHQSGISVSIKAVHDWRHLRTYRIRHALPMQVPPGLELFSQPVQIHPWLFVCGDYRSVASIQWALVSGRRAADAVIEAFSR